jgi:hypothetical protein
MYAAIFIEALLRHCSQEYSATIMTLIVLCVKNDRALYDSL